MYNDPASGPNDNRNTAGQLIPAAQAQFPRRLIHTDQLGGYGYRASVVDEPELFGIKLLDYWRILNRRKWLILGITAAFVALSVVRTLMQTPLYTATVRLQIDPNVAKIVESGNVTPVEDGGEDSEFMRTQYQVLQSRTMAERVASALKLGTDADFSKPREFSLINWVMGMLRGAPSQPNGTVDEAALERGAAGVVLGNRVVSPVAGSRLVDISYSDPVPARAQQIANAYADAVLASTLDKRFQANASAKTFLEDKIAAIKAATGGLREKDARVRKAAADRRCQR